MADRSGEYMGRAGGTSQVRLSHDPLAVTLMRARGHSRAPRATTLLFSAQNKWRCGRVCCSTVSNTSHQYPEFAVARLKISRDELRPGHGGRSSSPGGLQHWLPRGRLTRIGRGLLQNSRRLLQNRRGSSGNIGIVREQWDSYQSTDKGCVRIQHGRIRSFQEKSNLL